MTIKKLDKTNIDPILDEVMRELDKIGKKHGLDFGRKCARYTEGDFRMTITAKVLNREEGVLTNEELNYNHKKVTEGLPELGFSYFEKGITLTVVGWNPRARKYPIILSGSDGKGYKCSTGVLRSRALGL